MNTDLDVAVATDIMGWRVVTPAETEHLDGDLADVACLHPQPHGLMHYVLPYPTAEMWVWRKWHPSVDIVAAMEALEIFAGWKIARAGDVYYCEVALEIVSGATACEAICRTLVKVAQTTRENAALAASEANHGS